MDWNAWVDRYEKLIVFVIIVAVIWLTLLPVIFGYWRAGGQYHFFTPDFINKSDDAVYFSLIEQGRQGKILFKNLYTPEAQKAVLFSPLWLIGGWIGTATGWSNAFVFIFLRSVAAVVFLLCLYFFISYFFTTTKKRLIVFLLTIFASGFGGIISSSRPVFSAQDVFLLLPTDVWISESNTFLTLLHSALFIFSQTLILAIFYFFTKKFNEKRFLLVGFLVAVLAIIHPYDIVTICAVLGVYLVFCTWRQKRIDWHGIATYLWIVFISVWAAVYYYYITKTQIAIGGWADQNLTVSPPFLSYLWGYGLVFILALIGVWVVIKQKKEKFYFIIIWAITSLVLVYLPLNVQRRFSNGWHVALVILASVGIFYLAPIFRKYATWINSTVFVSFLIICFFVTNFVIIKQEIDILIDPDFPYLIPNTYYDGFSWIKNNVKPNDVVAADVQIGNLIPAFSGRTVYAGHGHQTIDFYQRRYFLKSWFFKTNDQDAEKKNWLNKNSIDYIWYSDFEKWNGYFEPGQKDYLEEVYSNQDVKIYQVKQLFTSS
ncbi:MAG: hypothetical protein WC310_02035 [Patescibacteria group bacterium]|jgi:hypothetical protein